MQVNTVPDLFNARIVAKYLNTFKIVLEYMSNLVLVIRSYKAACSWRFGVDVFSHFVLQYDCRRFARVRFFPPRQHDTTNGLRADLAVALVVALVPPHVTVTMNTHKYKVS